MQAKAHMDGGQLDGNVIACAFILVGGAVASSSLASRVLAKFVAAIGCSEQCVSRMGVA